MSEHSHAHRHHVQAGHGHHGHGHEHHGHEHHGHDHHGHAHHDHEPAAHARASTPAPAPFSFLLAGLAQRLVLALGALAILWPVTFWTLR